MGEGPGLIMKQAPEATLPAPVHFCNLAKLFFRRLADRDNDNLIYEDRFGRLMPGLGTALDEETAHAEPLYGLERINFEIGRMRGQTSPRGLGEH